MESASESHIAVIILDRPNPNGGRIDGEVLNLKYKSFVGMHPVPILYGMTIGEYALMINGEGWLKGHKRAKLQVVPLKHYTHKTHYSLPIKPSPNLPNDLSIYLYPSLAFFEGTPLSVGRGTTMQFQIYGSPYYKKQHLPLLLYQEREQNILNIRIKSVMELIYEESLSLHQRVLTYLIF